jgi:nitroreductase
MAGDAFLELVKRRRSIRHFLRRPVPRGAIESCIEAARLAPSAENVQPWRFLVLDERERILKFGEQAFSGIYRFSRWALNAPVLVVIMAKLDVLANRIGKHLQGTQYYLLDVGIAGTHLMMRANELGLGGCWIGWFNARKAAKALGLPKKYRVVCCMALGYYDEPAAERKKKLEMAKIAWFNEVKRQ